MFDWEEDKEILYNAVKKEVVFRFVEKDFDEEEFDRKLPQEYYRPVLTAKHLLNLKKKEIENEGICQLF